MMRNNQQGNSRQVRPTPKNCHFCINPQQKIDYKEATLLRKFTSSYAKIAPRRRSGMCAAHQRTVAGAIKRARVMALLPFVTR